jgi:hypothetical protein
MIFSTTLMWVACVDARVGSPTTIFAVEGPKRLNLNRVLATNDRTGHNMFKWDA